MAPIIKKNPNNLRIQANTNFSKTIKNLINDKNKNRLNLKLLYL